ncbi:MAG: helix-turn-helix domain-containing protein, partial [Streptosporangiaceae bacterium]
MDFAEELTAAMAARGIGVRALARRVHCDPALISRLATGKQRPSSSMARLLDDALSTAGILAASQPASVPGRPPPAVDDELAAIEAGRQAAVTDTGEATVKQLEQAVDDMALAYPGTPPGELLSRIRAHLGYVRGLLGGRTTLGEHRRLLVTTSWLSLLAATCLIDLHRFPA